MTRDHSFVEFLKTVYLDPLVWVVVLLGFLIMIAAGTVPGAVFILVFSLVYFLVSDEFS